MDSYYQRNKQRLKKQAKLYYQKNREKIRVWQTKWRAKNYVYDEKEKERKRLYYLKNKDRIKKKVREYKDHPGIKEKRKAYQKVYQKKYYLEHKEKLLAYQDEYLQRPGVKKWRTKQNSINRHIAKGIMVECEENLPIKTANITD